MPRPGLFVALALALHGILMVSILDIYFRSPVTHGIHPQRSPLKAPARRLVLFSSDGLRADKFFEGAAEEPSQTPFLRRILASRASWGVSHTRVPTESRPGHVAMIGGFYEDPAALLQGWQANPVPFDTVWNQSRYTWQVGSPDVIQMFGVDVPHVESHCFPHSWINFSSDPRGVDTWVLEKAQKILESAQHNSSLYSLLMGDKIVFFLHLLGMDTAGHQFRPQSPKYVEVLRNVDVVVERLHAAFEAFWPDGQTAYLFTSDHGMSNRGSHGDGSADETRCPFVAWGAGLSSSQTRSSSQLLAAQSLTDGMVWLDGAFETLQLEKEHVQRRWRLDPEERVDILQADLAPLMATLIGVPIPVNSVGVLNTHYLNATEGFKAIALLTNARQILEHCYLLADRRRAHSHFSYAEHPGLRRFNSTVEHILNAMNHSRYQEAHRISHALAQEAYGCISYYHKYDWQFLRNVIAVAYVLWILCAVLFVLVSYGGFLLPRQPLTALQWSLLSVLGIGLLAILRLRESPLSHYMYCGIVLLEATAVLTGWPVLVRGTWGQLVCSAAERPGRTTPLNGVVSMLPSLAVHVLLVETMVFGFYNRAVYSAAFAVIGLGFGVPYVRHAPRGMRLAWLAGCLSLTPYPWLPMDAGAWPMLLVVAVALAMGLTAATDSCLAADEPQAAAAARRRTVVQLICSAVECATCLVSDVMLRNQHGLPLVNRIVAWSCIGISLAAVGGKQHSPMLRIRAVALGLLPLHVALSVAYEGVVYVKLASLMLLWLKITTLAPPAKQPTSVLASFLGCALLFFFFMNAAFFTTGNLASISSFELSSVYRLTTQFNPLFMAVLLILKNIMPWMAVVMPFVAFSKLQGQPPMAMFALTFVHSDAMALQFFFLVQDSGSWKEIGHSISRFGITNCTIIVILLLSTIAGIVLCAPDSKRKE